MVALEFMGFEYSEFIAAGYPFARNPLSLCNCVFLDLGLPPADSADQYLDVPYRFREAVCYGTAMFISIYMGDALRQSVFTDIYNGKRKAALSKGGKIKDVMPYSEV